MCFENIRVALSNRVTKGSPVGVEVPLASLSPRRGSGRSRDVLWARRSHGSCLPDMCSDVPHCVLSVLQDEPSSGMDPCSKRFLWEAIRKEVREGCAVVLTSHR